MIQAKGKGGAANPSQLLPSELIDRCIGSQIWVILKGMLQPAALPLAVLLLANVHTVLPIAPCADMLVHNNLLLLLLLLHELAAAQATRR
jgi:hypothetical protein